MNEASMSFAAFDTEGTKSWYIGVVSDTGSALPAGILACRRHETSVNKGTVSGHVSTLVAAGYLYVKWAFKGKIGGRSCA